VSRFLKIPILKNFSEFAKWRISPRARAPHCARAGGYMSAGGLSGSFLGTSPRSTSYEVSQCPDSWVAVSAWFPTAFRGVAANSKHHLSTAPASRLSGARRGIWEDSAGAREYPVCAEGWAMWAHGSLPDLIKSHRGYPPVGEASPPNLLAGPPLGAPRRCVRGAQRLSLSCQPRSGEFRRGKRM
jgi:hypothetical protein